MNKENIKSAFVSIIIGATIAFFSTLFEGLGEFIRTHSTEISAGGVSAALYAIKNIRV